jgi:hypothetical protein
MAISLRRLSSFGLLALLLQAPVIQADWTDIFKKFFESEEGEQVVEDTLSNSEIISGLKEALASGVEKSVKTLGQTDGFLGDELVKIAIPESLKPVEELARKSGQGEYADKFVTTLNRAAEQAVPEAAEILGDAIRKMTVEDATAILKGPSDAATQYFRKVSEARLKESFHPHVKQATDQVGVTAAYKSLAGQAGDMLSGFLGGGAKESLDLDNYVTDKAMDGLFTYIAKEEKQIRENPEARTSDLLKKVFSSI